MGRPFIMFDENGLIQLVTTAYNPDPYFTAGKFWYQGSNILFTDGFAVQTLATQNWAQANFSKKSLNLADLVSKSDARSNLSVYSTTEVDAIASGKASISGATFTGKVNLATLGVATPSINLGGQCDSAPSSAANGDLWISNAASPKLTYKMGGVNYNLPVLNQFNTFTNQMVIDTTSSTTAALRVTQRGAGNAIEVEDSTTPDATKFVVDQFGKVGVGTAPDATAAIKIDGNGISFNGLVFNPTATAAHTGGSDTLDLLVTINGTNYRLGLRPA